MALGSSVVRQPRDVRCLGIYMARHTWHVYVFLVETCVLSQAVQGVNGVVAWTKPCVVSLPSHAMQTGESKECEVGFDRRRKKIEPHPTDWYSRHNKVEEWTLVSQVL